eukprot:SAG22_NODE_236_length_14254_cov_3.426492_5_plen_1588_part_00
MFWRTLPIALPSGCASGKAVFRPGSGGGSALPAQQLEPFLVGSRRGPPGSGGNWVWSAAPANASDPLLVSWELNRTNLLGGPDRGIAGDVGTLWRGSDGGWNLQASGAVRDNVGAFGLWRTASLDTPFVEQKSPLWAFNWSRCIRLPALCGGSGWIPRDPNVFAVDQRTNISVVSGAMKQCKGGGRDYFVLGRMATSGGGVQFTPLDEHESMGSSLYDGGSFFASLAFADPTNGGRTLLSGWVMEGDCDPVAWPLRCKSTVNRGWAGVHSLPRVVTIEDYRRDASQRELPTFGLKTAPLPALSRLRMGTTHVHVDPKQDQTMITLPIVGKSIEIELAFHVPPGTLSPWEARVEVLAGAVETTVVGVRSSVSLPNTDLEDPVSPPLRTFAADLIQCKQSCIDDEGCISWTSINGSCEMHATATALHKFRTDNASCYGKYRRDATSGYSQHTVGGGGTSFAQLFMDRQHSSMPFNGDGHYGLHGYAHSLRLRPGETNLTLRVFVDVSIVEGFAQDGRGAVTGRVYPTLPDSVQVRVAASHVRVLSIDAWKLRTAFSNEPHDSKAAHDWRNVSTGNKIWPPPGSAAQVTYQDQPQISVLPDSSWFVVWTHGVGKSEGARNIILSMKSFTRGRNWTEPVNIEPYALDSASSASWANPLVVGQRLYVFYTFNCYNTGRGGNPGSRFNISRNGAGRDANLQGCWFYKVSEDGGSSFGSTRHNYTEAVEANMRFALDRTNPYQTGTCKAGEHCPRGLIEGWSTGKPLMAATGDVYMQMTKIGGPGLSINQGIFLRSRNLHAETDPAAVVWDVLPETGGSGFRALCADAGAPFDVLQEGNIVEIDSHRGTFYAMARTNCGWITAWTSSSGGSNWSSPMYAEYDETAAVPPNISSRGLKQPCGPLCPRQIDLTLSGISAPRYLLLFYNNGYPKQADSKSREVYWVSAGRPSADGTSVVWSQPEVAFYEYDQSAGDPSAHSYKSVDYPDFVFQDGDIYVAATNKDAIATHLIPRRFWQMLLTQNEIADVVRDSSLVIELNSSSNGGSRQHVQVPDWDRSFTIEILTGAAFRPAPFPLLPNSSAWTLVRQGSSPRDAVTAAPCTTSNLSLAECGDACVKNADCRYFWFYQSGRCCLKSSFDLKNGWINYSNPGGWYALSRPAPAAQTALLDCRDSARGNGVAVFAVSSSTSESARPLLVLDDGSRQQQAVGDADPWVNGASNTVAVVVDGAAQLVSFLSNGVLADGGLERQQGWTPVNQALGRLAGGECNVGVHVEAVRVYSRALMTTELVGSWRSGAIGQRLLTVKSDDLGSKSRPAQSAPPQQPPDLRRRSRIRISRKYLSCRTVRGSSCGRTESGRARVRATSSRCHQILAAEAAMNPAFSILARLPGEVHNLTTAKRLVRNDEVARNHWNFSGPIESECGALWGLAARCPMGGHCHGNATNESEAAAAVQAVQATVDIECDSVYSTQLLTMATAGNVTRSQLEEAVARVYTGRFQVGQFDDGNSAEHQPFGLHALGPEQVGSIVHKQLALEAARQSIVLLRNPVGAGQLPLKRGINIAIIGPSGNALDVYMGQCEYHRLVQYIIFVASLVLVPV